MSRIGINPITIPSGVEVKLDGQEVKVKGKLGELSQTLSDSVEVEIEDGKVVVKPVAEDQRSVRCGGCPARW